MFRRILVITRRLGIRIRSISTMVSYCNKPLPSYFSWKRAIFHSYLKKTVYTHLTHTFHTHTHTEMCIR